MYSLEDRIYFDGAAAAAVVDTASATQDNNSSSSSSAANSDSSSDSSSSSTSSASADPSSTSSSATSATTSSATSSSSSTTSTATPTDSSSASTVTKDSDSSIVSVAVATATTTTTSTVDITSLIDAILNENSASKVDSTTNVLVISSAVSNAAEVVADAQAHNIIAITYDPTKETLPQLEKDIATSLNGSKAASINFVTTDNGTAGVNLVSSTDITAVNISINAEISKFFSETSALLADGARISISGDSSLEDSGATALETAIANAAGVKVSFIDDTNGKITTAAPDAMNYNIIFVDSSVTDTMDLLKNLSPNTEVYYISDTSDGVEQIMKDLAGKTNVDSIQIIAHGNNSDLLLGSTALNENNVSIYSEQIAQWGNALTSDGDILIYSCNTAENGTGKELVNNIALLTGHDVAASTDITGGSSGNWTLEYSTGVIDATAAFDASNYNYQLAAYEVTLTTDGTTADAGTLRWAVDSALGGGEVYFNSSLAGSTISLTKGVISISSGSVTINETVNELSSAVTISSSSSSIFAVSNSKTLTIIGGSTSNLITLTTGGAAYSAITVAAGASLTATHVTFNNCGSSSLTNGGAINSLGTVTLHNDTFTNCHALSGGAIYGSGTLNVYDSTFTSNGCSIEANNVYGGAIYASGGTVTLEDSTFTSNSITTPKAVGNAYGGAIYSAASLTVTNCTFSGNSANATGNSGTGYGGSINIASGGTLVMNSVTVSNSTATSAGGGICAFSCTMTLTDCTISGNLANKMSGGGIYANSSTLTLTNCTVSNNSVHDDDADNYAAGAGIYVNCSTLTMTDSTVSFNTAITGGGINAYLRSTVKLTNCTVNSNWATTGAGIYVDDTCILILSSSTVSGNSASGLSAGNAGTGIYSIRDCTIYLLNSIVTGNYGTYDICLNSGGAYSYYSWIGSVTGIAFTTSYETKTTAYSWNNLYGLANYGGDTMTMLSSSSSPANNAGTATGTDTAGDLCYYDITGAAWHKYTGAAAAGSVTLKGTDQRGETRPVTASANTTTIGAVQRVATDSNYDTYISSTDWTVVTTGSDVMNFTDGVVSLREAMSFAASDSTITFNAGVTTVATDHMLPIIGRTLTINGGSTVTISGDTDSDSDSDTRSGLLHIVSTGNLTLNNITVSYGSSIYGGGIYVISSTLTLTDSTVSNCSKSYYGGGIYAQGSTVTLTDSTVSNSAVSSRGGGIYLTSSTLTLTDSTIKDNTSDSRGGGIYAISSSTLTMTRSTISGNSTSDSHGGGVYIQDSTLTMTDSTVSNNSLVNSASGAGICAISSTAAMIRCTVSGNSITGGGGYGSGVYIISSSSKLTMTDCTISGNSITGGSGGGIYSTDCPVLITGCTLSGNSAGSGSGIYAYSNTVTMTNCTVSGNYTGAGANYGSVYVHAATLIMTDCTVSGNSAWRGAGIYMRVDSSPKVYLTNCIIAYNYYHDDFTNRYEDIYKEADAGSDTILIYGNYNITSFTDWTTAGTGNVEYTYTSGKGASLFASYTEISADKIYKPVLADNGGKTYTVELASNSIAAGSGCVTGHYINSGTTKYVLSFDGGTTWYKVEDGTTEITSGVTQITTDQRGVTISGTPCVGAYFRTAGLYYMAKASGNWSNCSIWYTSTTASSNPADYTTAAITAPNSNNAIGIIIYDGVAMTIDSNITIGQTTLSSSSSLVVNTGTTLKIANGTGTDLTSNGTITVNNGGTILIASGASADVNSTFTVNGSLSFDDTSGADNGTLNVSTANITITTLTAGSGTINYDGVNQSVVSTTYYNLTLSGSGTKTLSSITDVGNNLTVDSGVTLALAGRTATVTGVTDINGTLTASTGTLDANGAFDATGGNVTFTGAGNLKLASTVTSLGTLTASTSTVTYDGAAQSVAAATYYNLTLSGSGTKTVGGTINVGNNLTVDSGVTFADGTYTTTVTGTSDINGILTASTGTFDANGSFDATGGTVTFTGAGNLKLASTVTSLGTLTASTSTVTYDGSNQTVLAGTYYNLTISGSGTKTAGGNINAGNNLTVDSGVTFADGTYTTTVTGATDINGTLTASTGTFDANGSFDATGGTVTFTGAANLKLASTVTSLGTFTASTSTVTYDGAAQSVAAATYYNLTLGGSGTKTLIGDITVSSNLTLGNGTTLALNGSTLTIDGTCTDNGGSIKGSTASSLVLSGTGGDITLPSITDGLCNLTINRAASTVTLSSDLTICGTLDLTAGYLDIYSSNLAFDTAATVANASASSFILESANGTVMKYLDNANLTTPFTFALGSLLGSTYTYSPITITFSSATLSGTAVNDYVAVNLYAVKESNVTDSSYISRYWDIAAGSGLSNYSASVSAVYAASDVTGTESCLYGENYSSGAWTKLDAVNTSTHTITGTVSSFGHLTAFGTALPPSPKPSNNNISNYNIDMQPQEASDMNPTNDNNNVNDNQSNDQFFQQFTIFGNSDAQLQGNAGGISAFMQRGTYIPNGEYDANILPVFYGEASKHPIIIGNPEFLRLAFIDTSDLFYADNVVNADCSAMADWGTRYEKHPLFKTRVDKLLDMICA